MDRSPREHGKEQTSGEIAMAKNVFLASASPRRRELLKPFFPDIETCLPSAEEVRPSGVVSIEEAKKLAVENSRAKAESVIGDIVISGDTFVLLDGRYLGKPADSESAKAMLLSLSGRAHDVVTGVTVASSSSVVSDAVHTRVWFSSISSRDIDDYIATGEYRDKAGGYGIQGRGGEFVERIQGSWSNVVGLPMGALEKLLQGFGLEIDASSGPVVVVTGMPGAGKEEFVRVARDDLFAVVRMGDVVREFAFSAGMTMGDKSIGGFASSQRKEHGDDVWALRTLERISDMDAYKIVIDGTRSRHEIEVFRRALRDRMCLVAIDASPETRYERLVSRGRSDAPSSFEGFLERENRETNWGIKRALEMADFTLENEGSLEGFRGATISLLERLKSLYR